MLTNDIARASAIFIFISDCCHIFHSLQQNNTTMAKTSTPLPLYIASGNAKAVAASQELKSSSSKLSAQQIKLLSKLAVRTKLALYWPKESEFYPCEIHAHCPQRGNHVYTLHYDNKVVEAVDMDGERFWIVGDEDSEVKFSKVVAASKTKQDTVSRNTIFS